MVIHKCDKCGKEMTKWLSLRTTADAVNLNTNIYDLLEYQGRFEFCVDCAPKLFQELRLNKGE